MIAEWYIECDPWSYMKELIETKVYGETLELSIQCVCPCGAIDKSVADWQKSLARLFGSARRWDVLSVPNVCSILAKYDNGLIARIFVDESDLQGFENIEVILQTALIIWKPDVHSLSVLNGKNTYLIDFHNPYATSLEAIE